MDYASAPRRDDKHPRHFYKNLEAEICKNFKIIQE